MSRAAAYGTNDVHLRVGETGAILYFAIHNRLRVAERLSATEGKRLVRTWYQGVAEVTDTSYLESMFQGGQIPGDIFPEELGVDSARIQRGPCYPQHQHAEFMTIRVQFKGGHRNAVVNEALPYPAPPPGKMLLPEMGFTPSNMEKLLYLLDCPTGLVLFTGPTGSGKTTTIYQFLTELLRQRPYLNVVTAEDPPEIPIPGAVQLPIVNAHSKESIADAYNNAITTMLRMAPHVILIGEIRHGAVAESALEAAITGHKVGSTMHIDDALEFVDRFELLGRGSAILTRRMICDPRKIRGIVAQRLLGHLCDQCAIPLKEAQRGSNRLQTPTRLLRALENWGSLDAVRILGPGCKACNHTGLKGRYAVAEIIVTDTELMQDYIEHGTATARERYRARADADPSLLHAAIDRCLAGEIEPLEIETIDTIPAHRDKNFKPLLSSLSSVR